MPRADGSPTVAEMMYYEEETDMHFENIKFTKTGQEIVTSLNKKIEGLQKRGEEFQKKIGEVCKARELDPAEVIEAGEDQEKVASYSNKMSNSVGAGSYQNVPKSIIESLQADINNLRVWGSKMARIKTEVTDCERVKNNINGSGVKFELSYDELVTLGF